MYSLKWLYQNNNIFCVFFLFNVQVLNVYTNDSDDNLNSNFTISFHSHKSNNDDYDITTIYKMTNKSFTDENGGFQNKDFFFTYGMKLSVEIHLRTSATGMPLYYEISKNLITNQDLIKIPNNYYGVIENNTRVSVYYDSKLWRKTSIGSTRQQSCGESLSEMDENYYTTQSYHYTHNYHRTEYQIRKYESHDCYIALDYQPEEDKQYSQLSQYNSRNSNEFQEILTIHWKPDNNQTCLSITYIHSKRSLLKIFMDISDENRILLSSTELKQYNEIYTIKITNMLLEKDKKYELTIKEKSTESIPSAFKIFWFGLFRIAQCSSYDEEEVRIVPQSTIFGDRPIPFNILQYGEPTMDNTFKIKQCLNGGWERSSKCICPPGFKGEFCEIGCGSNLYGANCDGICSMNGHECRGLYMCTTYGCSCPAGLTGPFCNEDCQTGKYGANCAQTCSNCYDNECNQYTGVCSQGCLPGYSPPKCLEKYPYLINSPQLIESKYDSIKVELNFLLRNTNGNVLQLKYYQLLYKSLGDDNFTNSDVKLINYKNDTTIEIINDLQWDTTYLVGVLLIASDGNFNDRDIVFGQFKTLCKKSQETNMNVKIISGYRSINVTWNKIIPNKLECQVTKYILTLMYNESQNKISGVQEITTSSDVGHIIDDLLPGYKYSLKLTPITSEGPLHSSPVHLVTTLIKANEFTIKDLVTKTENENGKIKISWKIVSSFQTDVVANEPISCVVRYKVCRIFSCSLKEVKNNWTAITIYNRTTYEIFNALPNAQYSIQVVLADVNIKNPERRNIMYIWTPCSTPTTEPIFDPDHPIYITNHSVSFQWKFDSDNCSKLNGFFTKFTIELKDISDSNTQIKETKKNSISFESLKSNTPYELKVYINTNIGYNPEHFLFTNFTTKFANLVPVDDLVVYKKSLKNRMVGLRWSYSESSNLNGFIILFYEDNFKNEKYVFTIQPTKCSAWPEFYCHTFYNINPNKKYTIKVKAKSLDYPEGGVASSASYDSVDGLPDSPNNLKAIEIGKTNVTLQWGIPWIFNGELKSFMINAEEVASVDIETCCHSISPVEVPLEDEKPIYNYTLMDLKPGSTYSIGVFSKSFWYGSPSRISVTTVLEL